MLVCSCNATCYFLPWLPVRIPLWFVPWRDRSAYGRLASDWCIAGIGRDRTYEPTLKANVTVHYCRTILRFEAHLVLLHALWGAGFGGHHAFFKIFEKNLVCSHESSFWGD